MAIIVTSCSNKPSEKELKAHVKKTFESLIFVEGGSFMMGDAGGEYVDEKGVKHVVEYWTPYKNNKPAHEVILDSYSMTKHEITYGEYDVYTKAAGKPYREEDYIGTKSRGEFRPVWGINYFDARDYCLWLGKITGLAFDLPTEAQWEYAARSRGKNVPYATDNGRLDFGRNVLKDVHPYRLARSGDHPPSPLGFYDMTGNVAEWVKDEYGSDYYQQSPKLNPQGPSEGWPDRISRGGTILGIRKTTVHTRYARDPEFTGGGEGFRCTLSQLSRADINKVKLILD